MPDLLFDNPGHVRYGSSAAAASHEPPCCGPALTAAAMGPALAMALTTNTEASSRDALTAHTLYSDTRASPRACSNLLSLEPMLLRSRA